MNHFNNNIINNIIMNFCIQIITEYSVNNNIIIIIFIHVRLSI